jgi:phosphonate degradation associated HDIG domain protein
MHIDSPTLLASIVDGKGDRPYGLSRINQRAHALQAAMLAEQGGCSPPLIVAALLHDIGHMVHDLGEDPAKDGIDDRHEQLGHDYLTAYFGSEVTEPIRLHVAAKRYLCATEGDYFAKLSSDSVRSLQLQGGPMSSVEAAAFAELPFAADAVRLRRFDEAAKVKDLPTPPVEHYLPLLRKCLKQKVI